MRLLPLSQLYVATIATLFLAGLKGDILCAEAKSHHSLPPSTSSAFFRVDNGMKRSAYATTITSMVPRGGASSMGLAKDVKSSAKNSIMDISEEKSVHCPRGGENKGLIPRAKRGWAISLVLSFIYLALLLKGNRDCNFAADGFCVTNYSKETGFCPTGDNSHYWSWLADVAFTVVALVLGKAVKAEDKTIYGNIAAILSHGVLHNYLNTNKCASTEGTPIAYVLYFGFTTFIAWLTLQTGNLAIGSAIQMIFSLLVAGVTVYLSSEMKSVSPIFMATQILVSVVGFFGNTPGLTQTMGDFFMAPCAVSIMEFLFCCGLGSTKQGFFNKLGGHVWYDVALHTAILTNYFPDKAAVA